MAKTLEVSDRIKGLRSKLEKTQAQFAEALGVTQQSVSSWEALSGDSVPSPESYLRMGNLAPYPEALWFWEQAGIDEDAMLSMASKLLTERGQAPPKGKTVAVPRLLGGGRETGGDDPLWYVDAWCIPDPGSVGYWTDSGGARVLLDTSDNGSVGLQPFWDKVVLIGVTYEGHKAAGRTLRGISVLTGQLSCMVSPRASAEHATWYITLGSPGIPQLTYEHDNLGGHVFGKWKVEMADYSWRIAHRGRFADALVREKAREELRLYAGHTIMGRVIDLSRPLK